jgi:hypothetical protein
MGPGTCLDQAWRRSPAAGWNSDIRDASMSRRSACPVSCQFLYLPPALIAQRGHCARHAQACTDLGCPAEGPGQRNHYPPQRYISFDTFPSTYRAAGGSIA